MKGPVVSLLLAFLLLSGCQVLDRRLVLEPGKNQVLRVQSGDRLYFSLADEPACVWECDCDDADVDVTIRPGDPGVSKVAVRVHRGYDGPSTLAFRCRRKAGGGDRKSFIISLYRSTGDFAAWK